MITELGTVDDVVKKCRELGVLQIEFESAGVRLKVVLGPEPTADVKPVDTVPPEVRASKKRGKDGNTAEEQRALYGRVLDAEE